MGSVYFVRHGESEWNVLNKICGRTDIPLTEKGHMQAIETGEKIKDAGIKVDFILSSPLLRAYETAEHISEIINVPLRVENRLIEQAFGQYEGVSPRNREDFREAKKQFINSYNGGESMFKLAQRIYNLLDEIKADKEHTYILVAHNGIARVIKSYFEDMTNEEYADFGVANCSVTKFDFEN